MSDSEEDPEEPQQALDGVEKRAPETKENLTHTKNNIEHTKNGGWSSALAWSCGGRSADGSWAQTDQDLCYYFLAESAEDDRSQNQGVGAGHARHGTGVRVSAARPQH